MFQNLDLSSEKKGGLAMNQTSLQSLGNSELEQRVNEWLTGPYDPETKAAIQQMMQENPQAVRDAFYTTLSFGTGGLRGIMGVGSNRMNVYTVRAATQGLANYLLKQPAPQNGHSCFIGYDSRNHSRLFAEETAKVLAANQIRAYICKELRPTPLVSFGCRHYHCSAAVMVTASHNPPLYNGYKVYWNDGAQILPPHDVGIIKEVNAILSPDQVKRVDSLDHPLIVWVGTEIDHAYLDTVATLQLHREVDQRDGKELNVIYSSFHGTGITLVPELLQCYGFTSLSLVAEQCIPDGNFSTVKSPNPEDHAALDLGIKALLARQADLFIATDPDADRVGVVVRHENRAHILNGNQIACICLRHICDTLTTQNRLPERAAFVKTIPTTELFQVIAESYGRKCFNVPTGFKYIAEKIRQWEEDPKEGYQYIFGGEESYGYLFGTYTRDKDAVVASALICEVALKAKLNNQTLVDLLHSIYQQYGYYYESLSAITFPETQAGKEAMQKGVARLQADPPTHIAGEAVSIIENYDLQEWRNIESGEKGALPVLAPQTLLLRLARGGYVIIRPSGTEPKIKIYCGLHQPVESNVTIAEQQSQARADALVSDLTAWVKEEAK